MLAKSGAGRIYFNKSLDTGSDWQFRPVFHPSFHVIFFIRRWSVGTESSPRVCTPASRLAAFFLPQRLGLSLQCQAALKGCAAWTVAYFTIGPQPISVPAFVRSFAQNIDRKSGVIRSLACDL